MVDVVFIMRLI